MQLFLCFEIDSLLFGISLQVTFKGCNQICMGCNGCSLWVDCVVTLHAILLSVKISVDFRDPITAFVNVNYKPIFQTSGSRSQNTENLYKE